ncbi:MAG TPA: gamma-glutamyltransferase [Dongiaceae bacterium]
MRDFQLPGRSPIRASEAAASTSHPLATLTAIEVMKGGGNAIDAAVAASAVLAVVEPQSTGIGGDCFCIFAPGGSTELVAYNGSGRSAKAASTEWYRKRGFNEFPTYGAHAVTVPGAIDAWARLVADHGKRDLGALLQPAIGFAENGYVVGDRVAFDWALTAERLAGDPDAKRVFLPQGRAPRAGERHSQPALGATLRTIAKKGRDAFYKGDIAGEIVKHLKARGGPHEMEDFATAAGEYVTPVRTKYRGAEICQMPPNNQGLTALIMLNILSGFDLGGLDPLGAERLHLEVEAGRLAYRDRNAFIADPAHGEVPVKKILSAAHAAELRQMIDPKRAMKKLPASAMHRSETIYLCVVDRDRNVVSFINSVYHSFGSTLVAPRSGVVLQNRGASFRLDPRHPNAIGPGKRPMHTIMPGMALKGGHAVMPFGVMGGDYQPFGHVHLLTNILDYGMDAQGALDCARVFHDSGALEAERGIPSAALKGLKAKGHKVVEAPEPLGGGQAIQIDWKAGTLTAGSDPRKDGSALGW